VAQAASTVFACLPGAAVSEQVAAEVAASRRLRVYVEMSTIGSAAMARIATTMAARNILLVDCPISGGPKGARAGTLSVIAAGPRAALDKIRPLLARIGSNVFEVGERPGQAR
jgi:3-hydroxyisobutyrate dehydrogenase